MSEIFTENRLHIILEISNAINNNLSDDELMSLLEFVLEHQLNIHKAVALIKDGSTWKKSFDFGNQVEKPIHIKYLLKHRETVIVTGPEKALINSLDIIVPIYHNQQPLAFFLLGKKDEKDLSDSAITSELHFIQSIGNIIAVAIDNRRLNFQFLKQQIVEKDLELASEMQNMLIPKEFPKHDKIDFNGIYLPHSLVGGDYYDVVSTGPNKFIICLADVSGKGVAAALLMAYFQATLRTLASLGKNISEIAAKLNEVVFSTTKGDKYVTCFLAEIDIDAMQISYINAAHVAPVLLNKNQIKRLNSNLLGLGMLPTLLKAKTEQISIETNALLMVFTDGITETENEKAENFGDQPIEIAALTHRNLPLELFNRQIIHELNDFMAKDSYDDDVALLTTRIY